MLVAPFFPVGHIIETTNSANPKTYWGYGTWELYGKGRVTVAIDTADTDFSSVGKTGGSKFLQKHNHHLSYLGRTMLMNQGSSYGTYIGDGDKYTDDAGTGDSGNLQPYIVVYRWRRTK